MYDPEHLTGPERSAHKAQVKEKKCAVCVNRRIEGTAFGHPVLSCGVGMQWPRYGYCRGFVLDLETGNAKD